MNDKLFEIILTSSFTILAGIIILVMGQIIIFFILEPIKKLKKDIAEIADALIFYANIYTNKPPMSIDNTHLEKYSDASEKFRQLSTLLIANINLIPFYSLLGNIKMIPSQENIVESSKNLIGLSNNISLNMDFKLNLEYRDKIKVLLNLKF